MQNEKTSKAEATAEVRKINSELLAACNAAYEEIYDQYDGAPDSPTRGLGRLLEQLANAISKAEGYGMNHQPIKLKCEAIAELEVIDVESATLEVYINDDDTVKLALALEYTTGDHQSFFDRGFFESLDTEGSVSIYSMTDADGNLCELEPAMMAQVEAMLEKKHAAHMKFLAEDAELDRSLANLDLD